MLPCHDRSHKFRTPVDCLQIDLVSPSPMFQAIVQDVARKKDCSIVNQHVNLPVKAANFFHTMRKSILISNVEPISLDRVTFSGQRFAHFFDSFPFYVDCYDTRSFANKFLDDRCADTLSCASYNCYSLPELSQLPLLFSVSVVSQDADKNNTENHEVLAD